MSITEAQRILQLMDRELMEVPEVERVFGKIGRADTATDPAPLSMVETTILLKPRSEWREGLDWDGLIRDLDPSPAVSGHAERLVDADPDPDRDAFDRDS